MNRRLNVIPYQDCWGLIKSSLGVNDQTAQKNQSLSYFIRKTEETGYFGRHFDLQPKRFEATHLMLAGEDESSVLVCSVNTIFTFIADTRASWSKARKEEQMQKLPAAVQSQSLHCLL